MFTGLAVSTGRQVVDEIKDKVKEKISTMFDFSDPVRFEMCGCGSGHGKIYHKGGVIDRIESKKKALFFAGALRDSLQISEVEYADLEKQIIESKLPD